MMLGFQACQSVERYRDTDADNATDQLIDFSRRYADDPEETPHASSVKNPQSTRPKINSVVNKQHDDEIKFFCTEDTPSSASYSDLREVGDNEQSSEALVSEVQNGIEHCFSSVHNFPVVTPDTSAENCMNSNLVIDEIPAIDETEKIESNKEVNVFFEECANQVAEASCTKSSSPLMFSRSSSVGSLNSFELNSIVDDRSSISAFSNLASGMISPSEIPDSPFEVASPFISKSKNNEFQFPSNEKSEDPLLVDLPIPIGDYYVDDDIKFFKDEGECHSESNLSALSIEDNSTRGSISVTKCKNTLVSLTQKSSVTVNCSVIDGETDFIEKCQNLEISDKTDALKHNCIITMPSHPLDVNQSEKTQSIIETKYEDKGTSTLEDFGFHDSSFEQSLSPMKDKPFMDIKVSTPLKKEAEKFINVEGYRVKAYIPQYQVDILQSSDCSKDNSDDESDDLLAECILNGMPRKDTSMFNDSKQSLNRSFQTSGSSLKESFDVPNCSFSDNGFSGDDDDDDEIVNECVLLGMPQKSNDVQIETEKSSVLEVLYNDVTSNELPTSNSPNHQLKLLEEMLSQEKQLKQESAEEKLNLIVPDSVSNHRNFAKEEEFSTYNLISESNDPLRDIKEDLAKSDDDSDNEESDLLVQQIIQLGMPKNQLSPKKTKLPVTYPPNKNLGCRDNCPDGVSDGEDDDDADDILNEIIKAGKPDSKSETNKSYSAEPEPCLKSQNHRKLTAAEDRQLYLNKYYYGNIIPEVCATQTYLVDDNMHFYRTEGSPLVTPARSFSDLSTLSFNEDKVCQESFLNNSRNSDCSSESEDDELLRQCIRQGMPGARRVAA